MKVNGDQVECRRFFFLDELSFGFILKVANDETEESVVKTEV